MFFFHILLFVSFPLHMTLEQSYMLFAQLKALKLIHLPLLIQINEWSVSLFQTHNYVHIATHTHFFNICSFQAMPNLPSVQRDGWKPGDADDVPQPSKDQDALTRRQACWISDRWYILCSREFTNIFFLWEKKLKMCWFSSTN